jgi:hypothetical protein
MGAPRLFDAAVAQYAALGLAHHVLDLRQIE